MVEQSELARRKFLGLAAATVASPVVSRTAWGQAYPPRPVRIVVGTAAGGGIDIAARLISQGLSERLGQQFFVENRVGAGTNLGAEMVVRAAPDGLNLFLASAANAINATLFDKMSFDFMRDMTPVATIARVPQVMEINPEIPAKTVPEFIAYAKANPGRLNMASAGIGSVQQVGGELFKMMTGVNMVHVVYKGAGPALVDLIGGQMQIMFDTIPGSIEQIKAGKLRALAVTTTSRAEALPDLPPLNQFVPGYESSQWYGLCAPRNIPAEIVEKLNKAVNDTLDDPQFKARFAQIGATTLTGSPADFAKLIAEDTEKWGKVVKFSGAKVE